MEEDSATNEHSSVEAALESHTIPEVIALLQRFATIPRGAKRRRGDLVAVAEGLPEASQVALIAVATNAHGSKRRRAPTAAEVRPAKRRKVERVAFDDEQRSEPSAVHRGDVEALVAGPFLQPITPAIVSSCIARFIDRTNNAAFKKGVCLVCARRLFVSELAECAPDDIPNKNLLQPTHPHPSHALYDGALLHRPALSRGAPYYVCEYCLSRLRIHELPPLALANNMWLGDVPFALAILTLPERLLIALYFPAAYVVKLFPKKAGGRKWDEEKVNSGMRGNVSTYRLNTKDISEMVTGNLMPRPVGLLASVIAVTFIGAKKLPLMILPKIFDVRRSRVHDALVWLKKHNPLYSKIDISLERLQELPESGVPDEIRLNARYSEEETILDKEHAGYVPADLGDVLDGDGACEDGYRHGEDEEDDELPEVADGEERAIVEDEDVEMLESEERDGLREMRGRLPVVPVNEDGDEEGEYDAAVFPLQAHGSIDVAGDSISPEQVFASAAQNLLPRQRGPTGRNDNAVSTATQADYGIRPSRSFVNEYPRVQDNERFDGGAENPNHMLGSFPVLFPYGLGGLEVDRKLPVTYEAHIKWALQYDDNRFRKDLYFVFDGFGVRIKRDSARSSSMQIKRSTFIANEAAFLRLKAADFVVASKEEANKQPISNPTIRSLRKQITAVRARVMGTDESRISIRAQVWGMILRFNPPTLWTTINLSDTGDPIAQVLAGQEIDLDHFVATAGPDSDARSRIIANDPYAAAEYFHIVVRILLEEMFGITINPRGGVERRLGIVGYVNGYIGTVEAQARGTLHLHILFWLRGAPTARMMREALACERFREKMKFFISQNIRAHIPGTDATTLMKIPLGRNIAYSRPEDPRLPNYEARAAVAEARIARAVQPHECKPFTCLKLKKGRLVCKRRAPWRTAADDWVTEAGDWGPKRLFNLINAWNPPLLQVTRSNHDMKLVTNGAETKDITFYITLYIAKRQIQAANASALLAKSTEFQEKYAGKAQDSLKRNKQLLQRCANTLSRQHEFSAPEVISYLMGWGDRMISHTFVRIYWDQATAQLRKTFPYLVGSQYLQGMDSTMVAPSELVDVDETCTLRQNDEGVFVLKDQLKEYQDRGEALEHMNFYDYFTKTYDGKQLGSRKATRAATVDDNVEEEHNEEDGEGPVVDTVRRTGGRPPSDRVPYRGDARPTRCRVVRSGKQEVNLHFIGRWFPRDEEVSREYYCAQMLMLLSPWRHLRDLPGTHATFDGAFRALMKTPEQEQLLQNISYFYECSDRASQRREEDEAAAEEARRMQASDGPGTTTLATADAVMPLGQEPTEQDIIRAREERYAARDRIYGEGAVGVALERGIFRENYTSEPTAGLAAPATPEDMTTYQEWGRAVANYVRRGTANEDADFSGQEGNTAGDAGSVEAAVDWSRGGQDDEGGVVDLRTDEVAEAEAAGPTLNPEQLRAHNIIVGHLERTLGGQKPPQLLMIVQGEGGTGKTVLLNAISKAFDARGAGNLLAKTATTGVAATMLGGQTLHNWAGIGIKDNHTKVSKTTKEKRERNMGPVRYLVIDEYSMLTKKLLTTLSIVLGTVKEQLQECEASDCFGGINVILCGDLHQFPPVGNPRQALFYDGEGASENSPIGLDLYRRFTTVVTLTEQRRVTDAVWMSFLGRLRHGACTEEDMAMLERLKVGREAEGDGGINWNARPWIDAVLVTPRHAARERWNQEALRRHAAQTGHRIYRFPAEDNISKTGAQLSNWERYLVAQKKVRQSGKLEDSIEIAIGMRAMVLLNISTEAELANGTRGVVDNLVLDCREKMPLKELAGNVVELEYPPAVLLFRPDSTNFPQLPGLEKGIIPIVPSCAKFSLQRPDKSTFTVARRQVALTGGYAFTDYKAQGQTLAHVIIDLGSPPNGTLTAFSAYVALSRSHGRDSIRILRGFDYKLFTVHPSRFLRVEDERLRQCTEETRKEYP